MATKAKAEKLAAPLTWQHPTGRVPESVLIVALGPTKLDLLEMTSAHQPAPLLMDCDEVWGLNGGVNHYAGRMAYDVLWVMDHLEGEARREPQYMEHITRWLDRFGAPLITSQRGDWMSETESGSGWPPIYEYPIDLVLSNVGDSNAYFHNSIPYLLAYALTIGVKRLVIWGADYSHERSKRREDDRANAEYWVGFCRARGMEIWLPETTTLCNQNRGLWFYGYRDQPELPARRAA
jgi:hypothetical protein